MADYFLDDASNGTNDGASWATCYNTWAQVVAAGILATSGNRLFVGADANITNIGASQTLTGPASGAPFQIISSTVGSGTTVAYSVGTGTQIEATGAGTYDITFDGAFYLVGIYAKAGRSIFVNGDNNEFASAEDCTFYISNNTNTAGLLALAYVKVDGCNLIVGDTAANSTALVDFQTGSGSSLSGLIVTNNSSAYRSGALLTNMNVSFVSGCDFSSQTNATYIAQGNLQGSSQVTNCDVPSGIGKFSASGSFYPNNSLLMMTNCNSADAPEWLYWRHIGGSLESSTSIYRNSGAMVEGVNVSWLVATSLTANYCSFWQPFFTPWIYGTLSSTGSKTFSVHIANNTSDFTTEQAWLEVEVMGTADSGLYTRSSDRCSLATWLAGTAGTTGRDEDADWNGSAGTYEQVLSVTATVGEAGVYRARVCIAAGSRSAIYIDPKVTVA